MDFEVRREFRKKNVFQNYRDENFLSLLSISKYELNELKLKLDFEESEKKRIEAEILELEKPESFVIVPISFEK